MTLACGTTLDTELRDSWPTLARITCPQDVRDLPSAELPALAEQIRRFLVDKVSASGGHLGVNLGVVELTVALHRVFDSPRDVIVFDTGHQAYVHKVLTGRADGFGRLRQRDGLSGYPCRAESEHDWVENSHASTALSYADGIAKALKAKGELAGCGHPDGRRVVAVIGDGALTGGLAWEGLNNLAAAPDRPVVVILNDNGRSYAPTIGGIARHLTALRDGTNPDGTLFGQLGLAYLGPVDGHDVEELEAALRRAKALDRTVIVHAITAKGKGYSPAETDDTDRMHGIGVIDPATGRSIAAPAQSWTEVFGAEIMTLGKANPDLVCVTAAMLQPVGLKAFAEAFPDRMFDVGIAEQQAVCSAAGMAMGGLHPVVCLYATFWNRAFDQALLDVALHRLPVTIVLDRAGITGPDGPSHHGMWDVGLSALIPGLRVAAPRDPARLRELLREAVGHHGPTMLRFPKATAGAGIAALSRMDGIDILHRSHRGPLDVLLVAMGTTAAPCLAAATNLEAAGVGVTVADPRWILPVHPSLPHLTARHAIAVTVEDGIRAAGPLLGPACADQGIGTPVRGLGLPTAFIPHGDRRDLLDSCALSGDAIARTVLDILREQR